MSTHPEYFSKAFQIDAFKEGKSGQLELKATQSDSDDNDDACDDPDIVKLMMHYFYHLDYLNDQSEDDSAERAEADVHLVEHAKAFAIATKYQIQGLRTLATSKFKASVAKHWEHDDFSHAVHIVYTSTADDIPELRFIVADAIHNNVDLLCEKPEIQSLLRGLPGLAADLLERGRQASTKARQRQVLFYAACGHSYDLLSSSSWCDSCKVHNNIAGCSVCERRYGSRGCDTCGEPLVVREQ